MAHGAADGGGRPPLPPALARAGFYACVLAVFAAGWLGMQSSDWRVMLASALGAAVAALCASALRRLGG